MKILYIVSTLRNTGPTNQLYSIIHNLDQEEFTPHILTLSDEPLDSKKKLFEDDGVEIETLGLDRLAFVFRGRRCLERAIIRISPDLIHTSGIRADTAMNCMNIKIPLCSTIRCYIFDDYLPKYGTIRGTFMCIWHKNAIRKMQYPVCCSKTLQKKYTDCLKKELFVIQNGVDIQHYRVEGEEKRLRIKKSLNLPLDKKIIVVVGSLIERKDPMTIIKAVERVQEINIFNLLFIGDGELKEKLKKYETESIRFMGNRNNVSEYLQAADLFISASKSEGLPNTVLEAGAVGLPMILSDIPQHREIFENKAFRGVTYFDVGDEIRLAEIIIEFLNNCRDFSREEISCYIRESFDNRVMSGNYQKFYRKMCVNQKL